MQQADRERQALNKDLREEQERRMIAELDLEHASRRLEEARAQARDAADRLKASNKVGHFACHPAHVLMD